MFPSSSSREEAKVNGSAKDADALVLALSITPGAPVRRSTGCVGSERLRPTFEALLNVFAISESSLEKSVHQTCALPGHPAAQVLYFFIFHFLPMKQAARSISNSTFHQFRLGVITVTGVAYNVTCARHSAESIPCVISLYTPPPPNNPERKVFHSYFPTEESEA